MEDTPCYNEGIEDSIRRCEELLALAPLALETPTSCFRRGYTTKSSRVDSRKDASDSPRDECNISPEHLWKMNMDLLSNGNVKSYDKFHCDKKCDHSDNEDQCASKIEQHTSNSFRDSCTSGESKSYEWENEWSGASSEQHGARIIKNLGCQVQEASRPLKESVHVERTIKHSQTVLSTEVNAERSTQSSSLTERKESETISVRILDHNKDNLSERICCSSAKLDPEFEDDSRSSVEKPPKSLSADFEHSEAEISEFLQESETIPRQESSSGLFQACSSQASGNSDTVVDANWFISDNTPSPTSERKMNAGNSARLEEKIHANHFERQKHNEKRRSKSVSKELNRERRIAKAERSKSVFKEPFKERLQTLARPRTEVYKKLAELKAILEREKLQQCSFKEKKVQILQEGERPITVSENVMKSSTKLTIAMSKMAIGNSPCVGRKPDPESMHSAPIFERIMEMQQRMELRKRARKAYEKEELDNCSFWPQINWRSQVFDKIAYQPIQERFQELQRQKFEKIINAQLRKDITLTFKPEINQKSIQLCKQKGLESINVSDRLNGHQHSVHQDCKLEPQRNQGTFVPEINKNTDYIIASSKQFGGCSASFLERQKYYMQTAEEKKRSKQHGAPIELTFRPDIGNSAMILKQSHGQDILDETPLERFERLAYKDKEQLFYARQKAAESYYAQFQFHPEIDGFSRVLARSNSVHDLYKNEKGKKVKEALEQAAKNEFQQKCPFRPEVNSTSQRNENALQRRKQRKEKTIYEQESRTLRELEEMKECTFKPAVNPSPLKETAPAIIKGLERHLALQSIAKQMKKDHEELEKKVFFAHSYGMPTRQYTIPRPFMLHTAQVKCGNRRS